MRTVEADRLVRPRAGQTEVTPGLDIFATPFESCREDAVRLLYGQLLEWVVSMDVDDQGVEPHYHPHGFVMVLLLELLTLFRSHRTGQHPDLGGPGDQRWRRRERAFALDQNVGVWVTLLEILGP